MSQLSICAAVNAARIAEMANKSIFLLDVCKCLGYMFEDSYYGKYSLEVTNSCDDIYDKYMIYFVSSLRNEQHTCPG